MRHSFPVAVALVTAESAQANEQQDAFASRCSTTSVLREGSTNSVIANHQPARVLALAGNRVSLEDLSHLLHMDASDRFDSILLASRDKVRQK